MPISYMLPSKNDIPLYSCDHPLRSAGPSQTSLVMDQVKWLAGLASTTSIPMRFRSLATSTIVECCSTKLPSSAMPESGIAMVCGWAVNVSSRLCTRSWLPAQASIGEMQRTNVGRQDRTSVLSLTFIRTSCRSSSYPSSVRFFPTRPSIPHVGASVLQIQNGPSSITAGASRSSDPESIYAYTHSHVCHQRCVKHLGSDARAIQG